MKKWDDAEPPRFLVRLVVILGCMSLLIVGIEVVVLILGAIGFFLGGASWILRQ